MGWADGCSGVWWGLVCGQGGTGGRPRVVADEFVSADVVHLLSPRRRSPRLGLGHGVLVGMHLC